MSERPSLLARLLSPIVQLRNGEATTALLMFLYSFLAMTSYNIIKPITRSEYIASLGADNLPYVQFGAGILIGFLMQGYTWVMRGVPRRQIIPVTQAAMAILLVVFWLLFTTIAQDWIAVAFYVLGLILAVLLISQFWTLANDIYDARQAKRIFGFIGGGSSLGGAMGAGLTVNLVENLGAKNMLLISAAIMTGCLFIVLFVFRREQTAGTSDATKTGEEQGTSSSEAIALLTSSRHLQVISLVIAFAAIGAAIIEQQLNMAAAEAKGATNSDAIAAFLGQVTLYLSLIGFVIQVGLTSRIHRVLGIGFALLILPMSLGTTAVIMLFNRALWAPGLARILDTSLRYTVDKTSREVLFLPLPSELKYRAKPFIDVTMDRFAKGMGALMILVLIKDWGFGLDWQQLSYASLTMVGLWVITAIAARREYLRSFRRSIDEQVVEPSTLRLNAPDPSSVETLVSELAHPEPRRVLYAIDLLDAMEKRHLVTPLLLAHDEAAVRARALQVAEAAGPVLADRWLPGVERALKDSDSQVRIAAVSALAGLRGAAAADVMRPFITGKDPALAIVAAAALASSPEAKDVQLAEDTLRRHSTDVRDQATPWRLQVARALGDVTNHEFRQLLVPLIFDADIEVARAAIASAGTFGAGDFLFVPPLISLLRNRRLKSPARAVLVGYGEEVIGPLAYFMADREEDLWVRRHVPSTLALLPFQASVDALVSAMDDPDGFLRFKAMTALSRLHRDHPELPIDPDVISRHIATEAGRAFNALTLRHNLFAVPSEAQPAPAAEAPSLLERVLTEKHSRAINRTFALLELMHTPSDIAAVRHAIHDPDPKVRSRAAEYLDNLLTGDVRKRVMLLLDDMPEDERIRKGNVLYRTRTRDVEDTLAQLMHDDDQSIASAAVLTLEARGLWSLSDDLEHVLAYRDPRHQHVAEAASWALAANRDKSERRKAAWQESLPAVELADRLRHIPLFDFIFVDELFRLAQLGRQVRHEQGRAIFTRGKVVQAVHFLLDGRVIAGGDPITAPAVLGFEQLLAGTPMPFAIVAGERALTLSLTAEEFLAMLSDNAELAEGIFRMLVTTHGLGSGHTLLYGSLPPDLQDSADLKPVDRALLLQSSPLLSNATSAQLLRLSSIAREKHIAKGSDAISKDGDAAILIVLSGKLSVEGAGQSGTATAGDVIGMYETLAGVPLNATVAATADSTLLRIDRGELFDVLADHTGLLQSIFSTLLRSTYAREERSGSTISNIVSTP